MAVTAVLRFVILEISNCFVIAICYSCDIPFGSKCKGRGFEIITELECAGYPAPPLIKSDGKQQDKH